MVTELENGVVNEQATQVEAEQAPETPEVGVVEQARPFTLDDFMVEPKPITLDDFYPERIKGLKKDPKVRKDPNHKFSPKEGSEAHLMHTITLQLEENGEPVTAKGVLSLMTQMGRAPLNGLSRVSGHFTWMVRHGYMVRTGPGTYRSV